jgi:hypothetical protein
VPQGARHQDAGQPDLGHPILEGINYWDEFRDSPSQMEICFAIFVNVLELDDSGQPVSRSAGQPVNEKYAEKRAATWIYQYCTFCVPGTVAGVGRSGWRACADLVPIGLCRRGRAG